MTSTAEPSGVLQTPCLRSLASASISYSAGGVLRSPYTNANPPSRRASFNDNVDSSTTYPRTRPYWSTSSITRCRPSPARATQPSANSVAQNPGSVQDSWASMSNRRTLNVLALPQMGVTESVSPSSTREARIGYLNTMPSLPIGQILTVVKSSLIRSLPTAAWLAGPSCRTRTSQPVGVTTPAPSAPVHSAPLLSHAPCSMLSKNRLSQSHDG